MNTNTNNGINQTFSFTQGCYGGIILIAIQALCPMILETVGSTFIPTFPWWQNLVCAFALGFTMNVSSQVGVFNLYNGWLGFASGLLLGISSTFTLMGYFHSGVDGAGAFVLVILLSFFSLANIIGSDNDSTSTWNFLNTILAFGVSISPLVGGLIGLAIAGPAMIGMILIYAFED